MKKAVPLLAAGTFAIGTDTFVVAGVLPAIAADLHVSAGHVGQLITVYAIGIGVLSPILVTSTSHLPRKTLLIGALALFAAGNLLSAASVNYLLLLSSRVVAAAGAALYTPVAAASAAAISAAEERGKALATVLGGATIATVFGVPLAVLLGVQWQWRATFVAVAVVALAAASVLLFALPTPPIGPVPTMKQRLSLLSDRRITGVVATTFLLFIGGFLVYTYLAVYLSTSHTRLVLALLVFGVAGTVGNYASGRVTDRLGPHNVLLTGLAIFGASLGCLPAAAGHYPAQLALMSVWGISAWALTVPQQHRLFQIAGPAGMIAVGLNSAAVFLGIGLSASVGSWVLNEYGPRDLGYAGGLFVAAALLIALIQTTLSARYNPTELQMKSRV